MYMGVSPWWVSWTSTSTSPSSCSSSGHQEYLQCQTHFHLHTFDDLKHPFKAAGSAQVRSLHVIAFCSLSLTPLFCRISCRTKNRPCCYREVDWKERGLITHWKERAPADSWIYGRFVPSCIDWMLWYLKVLPIPTIYSPMLSKQLSIDKKK